MKVDLEETFGKRIKIDPKVRTISGVFFSGAGMHSSMTESGIVVQEADS